MPMPQKPYAITEVDRSILLALNRFHYLTAAQLSRLFYPKLRDRNRHAQRRLQKLATSKYALALNPLLKPVFGRAPLVYTLSGTGRAYLQGLGAAVDPYFRPVEEKRSALNSPFMQHRLATIDVMVAADLLCKYDESVSCPRMLSERELKHGALRVSVTTPGTGAVRDVAVIPDAWFQLAYGSRVSSIAVELDRATED